MKISEFEAALIQEVKLDAEISLKEVAARLGKSVSTVRSTLTKLEERGTIRFYPFVNVFRLGYSVFLFYFSPVAAHEAAILESLQGSEKVGYLARFASSSLKYCASCVCKTPLEYQNFLSELGRDHGAALHMSATNIQTSLTSFSAKYLNPSSCNHEFVSHRAEGPTFEADSTDHVILAGLLQNQYSSIRDLSRQLDLPHSTVSERVNGLRESGVIARFMYMPYAPTLGVESFTIPLRSHTLHPDLREDLFEFCRTHPRVTVLLECFGAWNFELGVEAPDRTGAESVVEEITKRFGKLLEVVEVLKREERMKLRAYPFNRQTTAG